jgi:hypothetical protein
MNAERFVAVLQILAVFYLFSACGYLAAEFADIALGFERFGS